MDQVSGAKAWPAGFVGGALSKLITTPLDLFVLRAEGSVRMLTPLAIQTSFIRTFSASCPFHAIQFGLYRSLLPTNETSHGKLIDISPPAVRGAIATATASFVMYPLRSMSEGASLLRPMSQWWETLHLRYHNLGLSNVYKGVGMEMFINASKGALLFYVYQKALPSLTRRRAEKETVSPSDPHLFDVFLAGFGAGMVSETLLYPANKLKVLMKHPTLGELVTTLPRALSEIQNTYGMGGLYRGYYLRVPLIVNSYALLFIGFEQARRALDRMLPAHLS